MIEKDQNLIKMWYTNSHITRESEGEKREKAEEKISEEIKTENFLYLLSNKINLHIQEVQL